MAVLETMIQCFLGAAARKIIYYWRAKVNDTLCVIAKELPRKKEPLFRNSWKDTPNNL